MDRSVDSNLFALLKLRLAPGIGHALSWKLIEAFGHANKVFQAPYSELILVDGFRPNHFDILHDEALSDNAKREWTEAMDHGIRIIGFHDTAYPDKLKHVYQPPLVLFVQGDMDRDMRSIAMVGTRLPSANGVKSTKQFGLELAREGIWIVSGFARGIDQLAHEAAIQAGGKTLAVLGSGLLDLYPPENKQLASQIAKQGALISEFRLHEEPRSYHFPRRNRVISGLSDAILVIEAPERSGALITVDHALEQGRDVFALPGSIQTRQAKGSNRILKEGAICATAPEDILFHMGWKRESEQGNEGKLILTELPLESQMVLKSFGTSDFCSLDQICRKTGLTAPVALSQLTQLETKGLVLAKPGMTWELSAVGDLS